MSLFVRKLNVKKWISADVLDWLDSEDIAADPVGDLSTDGNTLSVYVIEDQTIIPRIIAAVAAPMSGTKYLGYAIIPMEILQELGLSIENEPGDTSDKEVNSWHKNIIKLSGYGVVRLAKAIRDKCEPQAFLQPHYVEALRTSLEAGWIPERIINDEKARKDLGLPPKKPKS